MTPKQANLFGSPAEARFRAFHAANPQVYAELCRYARQLLARGHRRYGIMALLNIVRWHQHMTTTDQDYKLNNNYAPFYARLIMATEQDLGAFFETRSAEADA